MYPVAKVTLSLCPLWGTQYFYGRIVMRDNKKAEQWKVYGQLVLLGYDITAFTPATYQRPSLERPLKEILS